MTQTKKAKKITAKRKAAPSPVVVLEGPWEGYDGQRVRLVYSAASNDLELEGESVLGEWNPILRHELFEADFRGMPV